MRYAELIRKTHDAEEKLLRALLDIQAFSAFKIR